MTRAANGAERSPSGARFVLAAASWTLGLFALLRLPAVQEHVLLPLTRAQGWIANRADPAAATAVVVALECSGADVLALLAAAVFAYPTAWRRRLAGVAGGLGLLLVLNTLRIGNLSRVVGTAAFGPLHGYIWPAVLVIATFLYVAGWMWSAEPAARRKQSTVRWLVLAATTAALSCLFAVLSPVIERAGSLQRTTLAVAAAAADLMNAMGLDARAAGSSLMTAHGRFVVTPECLITPLMPVYLAAAVVLTRTWQARLAALAFFLPLFMLLGLARLLTLGLPPVLGSSPLFLVHGFHQLALGMALVIVTAATRSGDGAPASARLMAAAAAALLVAVAAGGVRAVLEVEAEAVSRWMPHTVTRLALPGEIQGGLLLLPPYQLALFSALWLSAAGWRSLRRLVIGLAVLHLGHVVLLALLGEMQWHASTPAPVVLVRAWALVAPLGLFLMLRPRPPMPGPALPSPLPA